MMIMNITKNEKNNKINKNNKNHKKRLLATAFLICAMGLTACGKSAAEYNNEGAEYFNKGVYDKAAEDFSQAANIDKEQNPEYLINLGLARIQMKDYSGAIEALNQALSYESDNSNAYRARGIVYYYMNEYSLAMKDFGVVIKNAKENYDDITLESMEYYAALQTYYKDYAGAIDTYTLLIRNNYHVGQQCFFRGSIYASQGMENEAVLDYEEALKEYQNNYEIYYNIYTDLKAAGFTERANSFLKRGLALNDSDNLLKGKTYYILEDYENAAKYLAKAESEGIAEAEYFLAMAYEKLGKPDEAVSMFESYLKAYPNDAKAYNQFGMHYMDAGDYTSALKCFITGLSLSGTEARQELLFNEACCYEQLHEYKTAYSKFAAYLEEYPNDAEARREYDFLSSR